MSATPEMLARLQGQQQPQAMPGGGEPGPAGTPMATPQKKDGNKEVARVRVHIAMNMLEQALGDFGAESDEGRSVLKTLSSLAKEFGDRENADLAPAEVMQLVKSMPQMGGGNEMQQQIAKMMQQQKQGPPQPGMPQQQRPM